MRLKLFSSLTALVCVTIAPPSGFAASPQASSSPVVVGPVWPSAPLVPLSPGKRVGALIPYAVSPGDTIYNLAIRYAIHPVRIYKGNARALSRGLQRGHTILIDNRRISPGFPASLSGIVLNIPEAEVYFIKQGQLLKSYPVGVSMSDWQVPIGQTHVVEIEKNPEWVIPKSIQKIMKDKGEIVRERIEAGPNNPLGVRWIGFADGTYGFHGTTDPGSIKHYQSHGCVRFRKSDILDLYGRVKVGTPVTVDYQPVLMAIDHHAVWLSIYPDIYKRGYAFADAVKALATMAGVTSRLHWDTINKAIKEHDGIVVDASQPLPQAHSVKPHPRAILSSPSPSKTPATPAPVILPSTMPSFAPNPAAPASGTEKVPG